MRMYQISQLMSTLGNRILFILLLWRYLKTPFFGDLSAISERQQLQNAFRASNVDLTKSSHVHYNGQVKGDELVDKLVERGIVLLEEGDHFQGSFI